MHARTPHARSCGAKTRTGQPCANTAVMKNGRCRMHGGKALKGARQPRFIHGRYSRYLPERMLARYAEGESDPELLVLRRDLALLEARIIDVLGRVDTGESGKLWRDLQAAHREFAKQQAAGDVPKMRAALVEFERLIVAGLSDWAAWDEIGKLIDRRRQLVESERKRLVESEQMISVERVMALGAAILAAIRKHVTDKSVMRALAGEIQGLFDVDNGHGSVDG